MFSLHRDRPSVIGGERRERSVRGRTVTTGKESNTHVIRIIHLQHPTPALIHSLVALSAPPHTQRRIHMHIVARQIQADQALEYNTPPRERRRQKHQQASRRAPIRHHIEHRPELGRLLKVPRRKAVQCVQQAGHRV